MRLSSGKVRIAFFIIVIATFVTVVELLMQAYTYSLFLKLGIFIPLIVVNCIPLGRAEAFAYKNGLMASCADGLGLEYLRTMSFIVVIASLVQFVEMFLRKSIPVLYAGLLSLSFFAFKGMV